MENCEICNQPGKYISPLSTIITCVDHVEYASVGQPEVIQKKPGIITEYSDKMKKCDYCGCNLTQAEINGISQFDQSVCCTKHLEARLWYQVDLGKAWFRFKEKNPTAFYEGKTWRDKFTQDWRDGKL